VTWLDFQACAQAHTTRLHGHIAQSYPLRHCVHSPERFLQLLTHSRSLEREKHSNNKAVYTGGPGAR